MPQRVYIHSTEFDAPTFHVNSTAAIWVFLNLIMTFGLRLATKATMTHVLFRSRQTTVSERSITATKALLALWVGIVSAAISSVSSGGSSTDCSSSDAYRHSTAYGCTTVDATAIDPP